MTSEHEREYPNVCVRYSFDVYSLNIPSFTDGRILRAMHLHNAFVKNIQ